MTTESGLVLAPDDSGGAPSMTTMPPSRCLAPRTANDPLRTLFKAKSPWAGPDVLPTNHPRETRASWPGSIPSLLPRINVSSVRRSRDGATFILPVFQRDWDE